METIFGEGWTMKYIIENGKLMGLKYHGAGRNMEEAIGQLNKKVEDAKKELLNHVA